MASELAADLKATMRVTAEVEVLWQTESGDYGQQVLKLREPTANGSHLSETLKEMMFRKQIRAGVTYLQINLSQLSSASAQQLNLFDPDAPEQKAAEPLSGILRELLGKYGEGVFYRPVRTDVEHPLPERRFMLQAVG